MSSTDPGRQSNTEQWHVTVEQAANTPLQPGNLAATVLTHGSLEVEYYAPRGVDRQKPHTRDEVYVVVSGQGTFQNGARRHPFGPGDMIFVPAGVEHRFEEFSDDFATWVVFYGPEGGEEPYEGRG